MIYKVIPGVIYKVIPRQVLDKFEYDGPVEVDGHPVRPFQMQPYTFIKHIPAPAKVTINIYDDKGQLGKNVIIDLLMRDFGALVFDHGDVAKIKSKIEEAIEDEDSRLFRKWRVIIFNLSRDSLLYKDKAFVQLLEAIQDGTILGDTTWDGDYPRLWVFGNEPITFQGATAGRTLFYKLNSSTHTLVFDRHLAGQVTSLGNVQEDMAKVTDEAAETGKDPLLIAFELTFEVAKGNKLEQDEVIDTLANRYPKMFGTFRTWGKRSGRPKAGRAEIGYTYKKTEFHNWFINHFTSDDPLVPNKIKYSNTKGFYNYYIKAK